MLRGLEPASGSALGGTTVTLFGLGSCADPVVQFDGVDQEILETSAQQIRLRTRPHRGGRAHVRVRCDDRIVNRHRGYLFEAELGFVGISPVRGAIAGGTEVYVVGQGFARGAFGHPRRSGDAGGVMLSDSLLRAVTPPGQSLGAVDLRLNIAQEQVLGAGAFTYYDPGFRYGGSRGGTPQGSMNVTVLNSWGVLRRSRGRRWWSAGATARTG